MRDKRFVAEHRGGLLTKEDHQGLIRWARQCSEHIIYLLEGDIDNRVTHALEVAKLWEEGKVPTGDAMKASVNAHAAAREYSNPVSVAVARSAGQTVATAHMADHSLGGALYALKALKLSGRPLEEEKLWQDKQLELLPPEIAELVRRVMNEKAKIMKV